MNLKDKLDKAIKKQGKLKIASVEKRLSSYILILIEPKINQEKELVDMSQEYYASFSRLSITNRKVKYLLIGFDYRDKKENKEYLKLKDRLKKDYQKKYIIKKV